MVLRCVAALLLVALATACSRDVDYPPLPRPATAFPDKPLPLDDAVMQDDVARVRALLEGGADPNARWSSHGDRLPLELTIEGPYFSHQGVQHHRDEIVRLLLQHGADPNARWCLFESRVSYSNRIRPCTSEEGVTPLIMAAFLDQADTTYMLLDAGADPRLADSNDAAALDYATSAPVFLLLQAAMFPDKSSRNGATIAFLQRHRDSQQSMGPWDDTALTRAAAGLTGGYILTPPPPAPGRELPPSSSRAEARLELILSLGANPNQRLTRGNVDWTPLAIAILQDEPGTVRTLVEHGADPNARWCVMVDTDASRRTRAADCNQTNGITPLMYAASRRYSPIEKVLVEHGADPSLRDWQGRTAADYGAKRPNPER